MLLAEAGHEVTHLISPSRRARYPLVRRVDFLGRAELPAESRRGDSAGGFPEQLGAVEAVAGARDDEGWRGDSVQVRAASKMSSAAMIVRRSVVSRAVIRLPVAHIQR
jgi:hypothetical protein